GEFLHVEKEEGFVFDDGPAESAPKLVLTETSLWFVVPVVDPGVRVEDAVANILKQIAVITVGAGFDRGIDHSSGGVSKLGGVGPRLYTKFLHGVRRRLHYLHGEFLKILRPGIVVDAIQPEIVLKLEISVHAEAVRSWICGSIKLLHSRLEECEVRIAASVEGKIVNLSRIDYIAYVRRFCLQQRLPARDEYFLVDGDDPQCHFDGKTILHMQLEIVADNSVESL